VLEVVCGIEDGTVGAWHFDGRPVAGFPVTIRHWRRLVSREELVQMVRGERKAEIPAK